MIVRGAAPYMELFSAGSGNRYLTGFKGQINVKHDGSGFVGISPSTGAQPHQQTLSSLLTAAYSSCILSRLHLDMKQSLYWRQSC